MCCTCETRTIVCCKCSTPCIRTKHNLRCLVNQLAHGYSLCLLHLSGSGRTRFGAKIFGGDRDLSAFGWACQARRASYLHWIKSKEFMPNGDPIGGKNWSVTVPVLHLHHNDKEMSGGYDHWPNLPRLQRQSAMIPRNHKHLTSRPRRDGSGTTASTEVL